MYRMGVMALLVQGHPEYDYNKCVRLALVHDVAECIVGDITPTCGVSDADKYAAEAAAIGQLQAALGGALVGAEVAALWREYEAGATPEAALVKDFDKVEMILQAAEYERAQGVALQEFFDSTAGKWRTETGRAWAAEVVRRRSGGGAAEAP
jgi:putative hydrolase of HD superfamily